MKEIIDDGFIEEKAPNFTKRALIMLSLGILVFILLMSFLVGVSNDSYPYSGVELTIIAFLSLMGILLAIYGFICSISAFTKSREKGVLKYFAVLGNGLLSMFFGLFSLGQGFDLYYEFFT